MKKFKNWIFPDGAVVKGLPAGVTRGIGSIPESVYHSKKKKKENKEWLSKKIKSVFCKNKWKQFKYQSNEEVAFPFVLM